MMHTPIQFKNICCSYPYKLCFEQFNETIAYGQRIAVIGQNGSGKSSLLSLLQGLVEPMEGELVIPDDVVMSAVPQVIDEFETLSGGQRFNQKLTRALASYPNVLLLDEPTNHLDQKNRQSLMRMLHSFEGTLVVVSHDLALLGLFDTIWHVQQGRIRVFEGAYADYQRELAREYQAIGQELSSLAREKKEAHQDLMREQLRAKNSRKGGEKKIENRKWPTVSSAVKMGRANDTANRKKSEIAHKRQALTDKLSSLRLPEVIKPKFSLHAADSARVLLAISEGSVGYDTPIVTAINLSLVSAERMALCGDNGSGKSTLLRAILGDQEVRRTGSWQVLARESIGYLDQHYGDLGSQKTVLEHLQDQVPWPHAELRKHLNDFLFRKNEEVNASVSTLSGGEKARLSLALIAAKLPKLLILDEITNNLDLETRAHVIQVLREYPGAMMVVSHDADFLEAIGISAYHNV